MNQQDIIIFDIDGTLADCSHRKYFVENLPADKADWKSFLHPWNVIKDEPIHSMIFLLQALYYDYYIYLCTGRPESLKDCTEQWLKENHVSYDKIFFRKIGDRREDSIIKEEILLNHIDKDRILFVVDDRTSVVKMWRKNGLKVLQCDEGNFK